MTYDEAKTTVTDTVKEIRAEHESHTRDLPPPGIPVRAAVPYNDEGITFSGESIHKAHHRLKQENATLREQATENHARLMELAVEVRELRHELEQVRVWAMRGRRRQRRGVGGGAHLLTR